MLSRHDINKMDSVEYHSFFTRILNQSYEGEINLIAALSTNYGHMSTCHQNISDQKILARCVKERKSVSKFATYEEYDELRNAEFFIRYILDMNARNIAHWIENTNDKEFNIEINYGDIVGYGFEKIQKILK